MNRHPSPSRGPAARSATLLLASAVLLLAGCDQAPEKARKTAQVKLLPDTPPPPPPPPKVEDRPPPKPDAKPTPADVPKPAEAPPQAAALKSDEVAGNGPGNGLTAGAVTQDYAGEKIGAAATVGGNGGGDSSVNRLAYTAYANATTKALNEFLARDKAVKQRDYQVHVALWLSASGGLQRVELTDSSGDADTDEALRAALARFPGSANTPPPPRLPQPLRLRVSNRMMG